MFRRGLALLTVVLLAAACTNGGPGATGATSSTSPGATGTTPSSSTTTSIFSTGPGGVVYWAEAPATTPNEIFLFTSQQYCSVANRTQFQELMFRPFYRFGAHATASPSVDLTTSLANPPAWSNGGKTVTVNLKGWKFHDGSTVDAQSVIFWMNMMKSESANWCGTAPGPYQFPQNIVSYSAPHGPTGLKVVFNLDHTYNPNWYLYNELSQITPIDTAWDVTSLRGRPGSGGCSKVPGGNIFATSRAIVMACTAVWTFDTDNDGRARNPVMGTDLATFASNPLWQDGVDGPWLLATFDSASGECSFVLNVNYGGLQKPLVRRFVEVPFASDAAEFSALAAGGPGAPQVGYLPFTDITSPAPSPYRVPTNNPQLAGRYNLREAQSWAINFVSENFYSTKGANGDAGHVFSQLYFRQALQTLIDQPTMIRDYFKGHGYPTYGPVPLYPPNPFATALEKSPSGPYPFSESRAVTILTTNGWKVDPGGTSTCVRPGSADGDCGIGIPAGTPLSFSEVYPSGDATATEVVEHEKSEWAKAGIQLTLSAQPFDDILKYELSCYPRPSPACHAWDFADARGWVFAPDYLPTGGRSSRLALVPTQGTSRTRRTTG